MKEKLNRFLEKRKKRLRYDFLPPMLEIIERPANPVGTVVIWMIIIIVFSTIIWAKESRIDIVVSAGGYVTTKEELITLKSLYSGRIDEVYHDESDQVKAGDAILSIDSSQQQNKLNELDYELSVLNTQLAVYTDIYEGKDTDDIDTDSFGDTSTIAEAIIKEHELYKVQLKEYDRMAASGSEEYKNLKESFEKEHDLSIVQNINSLKMKIHDTEDDIDELNRSMDEMMIKSPIDGRISQLAYRSEGTVLPAGETIAYIVPDGTGMKFRSYVADKDVKYINVGDEVNIKLQLYDDTDNEIVKGTVTDISDIAVSTQNIGNAYVVDIEFKEANDLIEHIGAQGNCDIIVGTRSILDYFLEPFEKGMKDSLKEM